MKLLGAVALVALVLAGAAWWVTRDSASSGSGATPEAKKAFDEAKAAAAEADKAQGESAPLPEATPGGRKPSASPGN